MGKACAPTGASHHCSIMRHSATTSSTSILLRGISLLLAVMTIAVALPTALPSLSHHLGGPTACGVASLFISAEGILIVSGAQGSDATYLPQQQLRARTTTIATSVRPAKIHRSRRMLLATTDAGDESSKADLVHKLADVAAGLEDPADVAVVKSFMNSASRSEDETAAGDGISSTIMDASSQFATVARAISEELPIPAVNVESLLLKPLQACSRWASKFVLLVAKQQPGHGHGTDEEIISEIAEQNLVPAVLGVGTSAKSLLGSIVSPFLSFLEKEQAGAKSSKTDANILPPTMLSAASGMSEMEGPFMFATAQADVSEMLGNIAMLANVQGNPTEGKQGDSTSGAGLPTSGLEAVLESWKGMMGRVGSSLASASNAMAVELAKVQAEVAEGENGGFSEEKDHDAQQEQAAEALVINVDSKMGGNVQHEEKGAVAVGGVVGGSLAATKKEQDAKDQDVPKKSKGSGSVGGVQDVAGKPKEEGNEVSILQVESAKDAEASGGGSKLLKDEVSDESQLRRIAISKLAK